MGDPPRRSRSTALDRSARPPLSPARKLLYALLPLLALAALAELAARLAPHEDVVETLSGFVEPDPDLIWRLAPTESGPLATNELGFRDGPLDREAEQTVLLLGDSVAWGDGMVDPEVVFPQVLERHLTGVEVINSGVPGYSTFQQADYLRLRGLALEPDVVVLQFCLNDVVERYETLASYGGDRFFLGVDTRHRLLKHSRAFEWLVRWMQWRSRSREAYQVGKLAADPLSPELEEAWELTLEEIDEIHELCRARDIPFIIVIAPYRFQLLDAEGTRQPQDRLLAHAAERDIVCIDPLPGLAIAQRQREMFDDESHFSAEGHALVAERLVEPVRHALGR